MDLRKTKIKKLTKRKLVASIALVLYDKFLHVYRVSYSYINRLCNFFAFLKWIVVTLWHTAKQPNHFDKS